MNTIALHYRPTLGSVFLSQIRILVSRYWRELLVVGVLTWLYQLGGAWNTSVWAGRVQPFPTLSTQGGLSYPGGFIFFLVTAVWAIKNWGDLQPGDRHCFLSYPVARSVQTATRLMAGLTLYLTIVIGMWIVGMVIVELIFPGESWFTSPLHQGSGWIISLLGIVNTYLLASCFALLVKRAEIWFFVGLPVGFSLLSFFVYRSNSFLLQEIFASLLSWPTGLYSGLAIASPILPPTDSWEGMISVLPDITTVLIWTLILGSILMLPIRFQKEA